VRRACHRQRAREREAARQIAGRTGGARPLDAGRELRDRGGRHDGDRRGDEHQLDERVAGGYCPVFPAVTVMSGFILRKLFSPTPLTFIRSSTFLKPPFFWR